MHTYTVNNIQYSVTTFGSPLYPPHEQVIGTQLIELAEDIAKSAFYNGNFYGLEFEGDDPAQNISVIKKAIINWQILIYKS